VLLWSIVISSAQAQQLEYFIKQGLSNSPLLKDYQNQLGLAEADSLLVKAGQKPQVNSNSQVMVAPYNNSLGYDAAITNGGNYASVVDVSQYIFNGKTLKNKYENIALQNQSLRNTTKISSHDLIKTITGQYLTALADYYEVDNLQAYSELLNQQMEILKQLVLQAIYKQSDYLALKIESQTAEISFNQAQSQFLTDVSLLKQICGIADTAQLIPQMPKIETTQNVSIEKSPLFLQYAIDSLKLINEQQSINLRYRPKINWFADAGLMTSTPTTFYHNFGYSVGLNMSFPIFDGHQRKLEYQKISIRENTRSNYKNYFTNQYFKQVEQLNTLLQTNRKNIAILKSQESSAQELILLLKIQLNSGNTTITELINAMKNLLSVTHNIHQSQLKEFGIINELNYLMQQ
jgi:outer membrane protein TolC